jgi:hypothetical protein
MITALALAVTLAGIIAVLVLMVTLMLVGDFASTLPPIVAAMVFVVVLVVAATFAVQRGELVAPNATFASTSGTMLIKWTQNNDAVVVLRTPDHTPASYVVTLGHQTCRVHNANNKSQPYSCQFYGLTSGRAYHVRIVGYYHGSQVTQAFRGYELQK